MRKRFLSLLTVLSVIFLLGFALMTPALADTKSTESGGTGLDRYVTHEISTQNGTGAITYFNSTMNLTAPETISENFTFEGTVSVDHQDSYTNLTTNNITLTITNETGATTKTFTKSVELGVNETKDFTIDTDFPKDDNCSLTVEYTHNQTSLTASKSVQVDVVSNIQYQTGWVLIDLIGQLIPVIVIIAVVIPVLKSLLSDFGDTASSATGGSKGNY